MQICPLRTPLNSDEMALEAEFIRNLWESHRNRLNWPPARSWPLKLHKLQFSERILDEIQHHYQRNVFTRWLGPISIRPYLDTPVSLPSPSLHCVCVFYLYDFESCFVKKYSRSRIRLFPVKQVYFYWAAFVSIWYTLYGRSSEPGPSLAQTGCWSHYWLSLYLYWCCYTS